MREIRPSGSEGGARFKPSFLPLSMAQASSLLEGGSGAPQSPKGSPIVAMGNGHRYLKQI